MLAPDGWLPDQIFTRGRMNNLIKTLSSTHLPLPTKRYLQETSGINH